MSLDHNRQCVTSKYFVGGTVMDDSFSDFQETKQNHKGPRVNHKSTKPKDKKTIKRIKGQKDIRTVLKKHKSDLISYTKEFDNICKNSGVDVDSEQLQLAITLSKSLQSDISDTPISQTLTKQGRLSKIRTTLQEYGFRVPVAKINNTKKRIKWSRKLYKLVSTTEDERREKITTKYAQVLFNSLCNLNEICFNNESQAPLFHLASNCTYEYMKDNNIFYVDKLLEKSVTSGYMLRDWAEIPGRPVSPLLYNNSRMDFSELSFSQGEVDVILSGTIKSAKKIVTHKKSAVIKQDLNVDDIIIENENLNNVKKIQNYDCIVNNVEIKCNNKTNASHIKDLVGANEIEINDLECTEQVRCSSPDLFDDEDSYISISQKHNTKIFNKDDSDMDLTKGANHLCLNTEKTLLTSKNETKQLADDFMELTECAVSASQGIQEVNVIDLTQITYPDSITVAGVKASSDYKKSQNEDSIIKTSVFNYSENKPTHISDNNRTQKFVKEDNREKCFEEDYQVSKCTNNKKKIELVADIVSIKLVKDNIDLTQSFEKEENTSITLQDKQETIELECMDLTQSSKSSVCLDDLPEIKLDKEGLHPNLDNTIILNEEEYSSMKVNAMKSNIAQNDQVYDLTQDHNEPEQCTQANKCQIHESFYDDYDYDHSGSKINVSDKLHLDSDIFLDTGEKRVYLDVIQSPVTAAGSSMSITPVSVQAISRNSSPNKKEDNTSIHYCRLGKRDDDRSIVYDEICENTTYASFIFQDTSGKDVHEDIIQSPVIPNISTSISPISSDSINKTKYSSLGEKDDNTSIHYSRLGKRDDNTSIDYDEICEFTRQGEDRICKAVSMNSENNDSSKSENCNNMNEGDNDLVSLLSQNSEIFDLTDKELEYSLHKSACDIVPDDYNLDFGGISMIDNNITRVNLNKSIEKRNSDINNAISVRKGNVPISDIKATEKLINNQPSTFSAVKIKDVIKSINNVTPNNSEYIIKTHKVTPMSDYESMTTPQRNKELDKYGLRPIKRKRAIQILTHLYNQTHPVIESCLDSDQSTPSKKFRQDNDPSCSSLDKRKSPRKEISKIVQSPEKKSSKRKSQSLRKYGNRSEKPRDCENIENIVYEITSEVSIIKSVDCYPDDWVFQKKEKAKIHSCRVPLHIAFHNYVSTRRSLREAILKYEPVNIDVIHKDLVSYGHRYDPKDLLRFLDKKCITVKTTENNARKKR